MLEALIKNLSNFSFNPVKRGAGTKNEFTDDFPLRCLLEDCKQYPEFAQRIKEHYNKAKGDQGDFVCYFLEDRDLTCYYSYTQIATCPRYEYYLRQVLINFFNGRSVYTYADAGSVCLVSKDLKFSTIFPNGYGDGEVRVGIFEADDCVMFEYAHKFGLYKFNADLMRYAGEVNGQFYIQEYDCTHLEDLKQDDLVKELNGHYGVYYWNGFVALVKRPS